jgi:carbonic anhydrase
MRLKPQNSVRSPPSKLPHSFQYILESTIVLTRYSIEDTIKEDVAFLKNSKWIKNDIEIVGLKYDLKTGVLERVV